MGAQNDLASLGVRRQSLAAPESRQGFVDQEIELAVLIEIAVSRRPARVGGAAEFYAEGWSDKDCVCLAGIQLFAQTPKERCVQIVFNSLGFERSWFGVAEGLDIPVKVND